MSNTTKDIDIKSHACYFFNSTINIKKIIFIQIIVK